MDVFQGIISKLQNKHDLNSNEASGAFTQLMSGTLSDESVAQFLLALKNKGETLDEMIAAARVLRSKARHFKAYCFKAPEGFIDTCGTGGDGLGTYNISTAVMFLVAACGVPVAKHGNRAVSSKSGSADVLEALGVNILASTEVMEKSLQELGVGFMLAPLYHSAMKQVAQVRRTIGERTIFNILGPLINPASVSYQLLGVYDQSLLHKMAEALKALGLKKAWVVCGTDGLDELTVTGKSYVAELMEGKITEFTIDPRKYGIPHYTMDQLKGGDANYNAQALKALLQNKGEPAYRDAVILNAAACLYIVNKVDSIDEGIELARNAIESGRAYKVLNDFIAMVKDGN